MHLDAHERGAICIVFQIAPSKRQVLEVPKPWVLGNSG